MDFVQKTNLSETEKQAVCKLWNQEYPKQISYVSVSDFDAYLNRLGEAKHFLVYDQGNDVKGWAFTFVRESEKWFAILLDEKIQGRGLGSRLLSELKKVETKLNGWVVDHDRDVKQNGNSYLSPLSFYLKNDFLICNETRTETEFISAVKITWCQI